MNKLTGLRIVWRLKKTKQGLQNYAANNETLLDMLAQIIAEDILAKRKGGSMERTPLKLDERVKSVIIESKEAV